MSAAEKLKALEVEVVDVDGSPVVLLPWYIFAEIVAVVTTAEKVQYQVPWTVDGDGFKVALAALDDALSPPTGGSP